LFFIRLYYIQAKIGAIMAVFLTALCFGVYRAGMASRKNTNGGGAVATALLLLAGVYVLASVALGSFNPQDWAKTSENSSSSDEETTSITLGGEGASGSVVF
jgi:hypothetical protein